MSNPYTIGVAQNGVGWEEKIVKTEKVDGEYNPYFRIVSALAAWSFASFSNLGTSRNMDASFCASSQKFLQSFFLYSDH